jgi:mannose-6-phosphate isomerase-like protein (cupin superfamily)
MHVSQKAMPVAAGQDGVEQPPSLIWGLIPLSIKLSGQDTGGNVLLFEHPDMGKGGPPRHVHLDQDEWFYVVKGEFVFEVGDETHRLHTGDTLFAPRNVPHGWARVGEEPGTLLTMVTPVGAFETFILGTTRHSTLPSPEEVEKAFAAHGMKVVGPPIAVD